MVIGDKHYKHTDEGPCRSSRRTRSPSVALPSAATATTSSTDDADGNGAFHNFTVQHVLFGLQTISAITQFTEATNTKVSSTIALKRGVIYLEVRRIISGQAC